MPPDNSYERVALSTLVDGDVCLTVSWWAPEASDWRPAWAPKPDELHIYVGSVVDRA